MVKPFDVAWALLKANSPEEEKVAEMLRAAEERKRIELWRMTGNPEKAAEARQMLRDMDDHY